MTRHDPKPTAPLDARLAQQARRLRAEAPADLHARILERVERERVAHRRRGWRPLAAAALLMFALGWGAEQWTRVQRAQRNPVPMQVLQEVTAAPARAVRRLTDAPALLAAGRELRGEIATSLDGLGARAGAVGLALARRLAGPLGKLGGLN